VVDTVADFDFEAEVEVEAVPLGVLTLVTGVRSLDEAVAVNFPPVFVAPALELVLDLLFMLETD
jgi:hypothetical protein